MEEHGFIVMVMRYEWEYPLVNWKLLLNMAIEILDLRSKMLIWFTMG